MQDTDWRLAGGGAFAVFAYRVRDGRIQVASEDGAGEYPLPRLPVDDLDLLAIAESLDPDHPQGRDITLPADDMAAALRIIGEEAPWSVPVASR